MGKCLIVYHKDKLSCNNYLFKVEKHWVNELNEVKFRTKGN